MLTKSFFFITATTGCGRRGGLVVSALYSGSRGPGSSPGPPIVLCSWARHFTLTVPLSTQEYIYSGVYGYRRNAGGLPAMYYHSIQEE